MTGGKVRQYPYFVGLFHTSTPLGSVELSKKWRNSGFHGQGWTWLERGLSLHSAVVDPGEGPKLRLPGPYLKIWMTTPPPTLSEGVDPPSAIAPNDLLSRVGSQNTGYFLLIKEH